MTKYERTVQGLRVQFLDSLRTYVFRAGFVGRTKDVPRV